MFESLTEKFEKVLKNIKGQGKITESNISDAMREVRRALLDADVNFHVVKSFIARVKEKSMGQEVLNSLMPGQLVIKIVHDELVQLLGGEARDMDPAGKTPFKIVLVGLQGSGKTTFAAKLALYLRKKHGRKVLLSGCDVYRPAARDQLRTLAQGLNIDFYSDEVQDPLKISKQAVAYAKDQMDDVIIYDTAGRTQLDESMMDELESLIKQEQPNEIFFVADAMTGQEAVNVAKAFYDKTGFTGVCLTKMDGDARGGAALSIKEITGSPIRFIGTGEKADALELFHPDRMASRIFGMGDVLSLVEKAQDVFDEKEAKKLEKKIRKNSFDFEDFRTQLQQMKKMGSIGDIMKMIPGIGNKMGAMNVDEQAFVKNEAIINSMTMKERRNPKILNGSRRKRIATGCGRPVMEINRLIKQFQTMQKMMKKMGKLGPGGMNKMLQDMPMQGL
jgi:signal recognition particle subunit SRP54